MVENEITALKWEIAALYDKKERGKACAGLEEKERRFREIVVNETWRDGVVLEDWIWLLENLKIKDKDIQISNFKLKWGQKHVLSRVFHEQWKKKKPMRVIILKARRWGGSTLVAAINYMKMACNPESVGRVISYEDPQALELYEIFNRFWESDALKYPKKKGRDNSKAFAYDGYSGKYTCDSGYKENIGRGSTINILHMSEVAFWRVASSSFLSLLITVPNRFDSIIAVESTGDGQGGEFYEMWRRLGDGYLRIFVPWTMDIEECMTEIESNEERQLIEGSLSEHEAELVKFHSVSLEMIKYRRFTKAAMCGDSESGFRQEYPFTEDDAFQGTGQGYMSGSLQLALRKGVEQYKKDVENKEAYNWRGELIVLRDKINPFMFTRSWQKMTFGRLEIFEKPIKEGRYTMGVDIAEGIEINPKDKKSIERDNSCIQLIYNGVFDTEKRERTPMRQVAVWVGKCDPEELAYFVQVLGYKYNFANVVPEANNMGTTTISWLLGGRDNIKLRGEEMRPYIKFNEMKLTYPRMRIWHQAVSSYDPQEGTGFKVYKGQRIGWLTGSANRGFMLSALVESLQTGNLEIREEGFVEECSTFIRDTRGNGVAQYGYHDDRVMAMAMAVQGALRMSSATGKVDVMTNLIEERLKTLKAQRRLKSGQSHEGMTAV